MLDRPEIPVVDHGAGEQDADAAGDRRQHREPPRPAVDRFHRGVEAHGPAPEQGGALGGGAAVHDLVDLALGAVAAGGQDRAPVHGEEQRRPVEEDDREHVERVVEQVAVAQRERGGPIEVGEDAEGHRLAPRAHQKRADEAEHEVEPDRRGEGPGHVRAHAERPGAAVHPHPPQQNRGGEEEARDQPPAALVERRQHLEAVLGQRRLEREPGELADELDRVPVHAGPHVEADDLEGDQAAGEGQSPEIAAVDRPDLAVADQPEQVAVERSADAGVGRDRDAVFRLDRADLHLREDVLIIGHGGFLPGPAVVRGSRRRRRPPSPEDRTCASGRPARVPGGGPVHRHTGRLSHQPHHSGHPCVQKGPEMTMQTALQNPAESARNRPSRWMPSVPIE
ncbi:hypothetical protein MSPGM_26920 [Methylorubrum sp. GM97]|nr:hypothetical protein MSPGM_26920 [Methylorubrum sp. GM97]